MEQEKVNLKYEELDKSEEFSLGGFGIGALVITGIAIVTQLFMQLI